VRRFSSKVCWAMEEDNKKVTEEDVLKALVYQD
jgi:hypothetical protein